MFIAVITGCVFAFFIVFLVVAWHYAHSDPDFSGAVAFLAVVLFIIICIQAIVWPIAYFNSMSRVAELEAFSSATLAAFEYTADKAENVDIYVSDSSLIDAGYWEQGKNVVDCLEALRDKVSWYNSNLARNRRFNENWFLDGYLANAPSNLQYIRIVMEG